MALVVGESGTLGFVPRMADSPELVVGPVLVSGAGILSIRLSALCAQLCSVCRETPARRAISLTGIIA